MAKIVSFVYCEKIEQDKTPQNIQTHIIGPIGVICPIGLPSNYTFSVACTVADFEQQRNNTIRMQFMTPSDGILNDTGDIDIPSQGEEGMPVALQLNLQFNNLPLIEEGEYKTKVLINNELIHEYPISVCKKKV